MKHCSHCNIDIAENAYVCPLCLGGLEETKKEDRPVNYPRIDYESHNMRFIVRLGLFLSFLVCGILIVINYVGRWDIWWSLITTGGVLYFWLTIYYSVQHNSNSAAKILVQTAAGWLLAWAIDWILGYSGWSVNYVLPAAILVANQAMLVVMIVNFMNWQSYILFQIEYVMFSLIPLFLVWRGVITHPVLSYAAAASSVVILVGTLIFGDRKAKNELKRRFHV